jgi:subtilisin family serine protease
MLSKLSNRVRLTLAVVGFAVLAAGNLPSARAASAFVEPSLRTATGPVKVIVVFKDRAPIPPTARSLATYSIIRRALEVNSTASQKNVAELLRVQPLADGAIHFKSLWLINAMLIELPASKVALLETHPDVKAIYANRTMHIIRDIRGHAAPTVDPFTYGLTMMGIPQVRQENPAAIGTGVTVGILDTGVDANHPDLKGKVVNFKDFINNKTTAYDDHGHGTHVSGTIAGGNTSGTAIGIAPGAKIIMGKVFGADGSASQDELLAAMQWIADPDGNPATHDQPALVSNSWGGTAPSPTTDPTDDVFCQALSSWLKLGIFPVFAAGNDGPDSGTVGSPGACPQAYAIGAVDEHEQVADFSSRGPTKWKSSTLNRPNVSAPGVDILSAKPGGSYQTMSGTSMATPHAAGLLTLIYQAMPNISIDDAAKLVSTTSKDLGDKGADPAYGAGRIDALAAIHAAKAFRISHAQ